MKSKIFKKLTVFLSFIAIASIIMSLTASAAPLKRDPTRGYATSLPSKNDQGVLVYEDFESVTKDSDGKIGKFVATVPDDSSINPATVEIVSGVAHSGSKSLKVSARGVNSNGDPQGYNTVSYKDIGIDIAEKFIKDPNNPQKTENYFISAWVRNVDPNVTQYFWLQLQYGGSGEVWLPGQTYFEVKGDKWTQIGISVVDNKTYFLPFIEDSTKSGIYPPRSGVSTWSALKFITKNPKKNPEDKNEKMIQTNYDFYVDDIVIWKVDDTSKLIPALPSSSSGGTTTKPKDGTTAPAATTRKISDTTSDSATDPSATETQTPITEETGANTDASTDTSTSSSLPAGNENPDNNGSNALLIVLIVVAAIIVLGGGGFGLYWFKFRKKA